VKTIRAGVQKKILVLALTAVALGAVARPAHALVGCDLGFELQGSCGCLVLRCDTFKISLCICIG
jgi:hypothetical protein